jgi:PAS domain S-box-containing protein
MTSHDDSLKKNRIPLRRITIASVLIWTVVAAAVYFWEVIDNRSFVTANAKAIAQASYEKDIAFRRWAAKHGGVYVPATTETPANPYLTVPERDILTPSGRQLTLMNPAYMTRQVYEIMHSVPHTLQGHITSLNPIRPENAPDAWEQKTLAAFEKGAKEFSEYQEIGGKRHFRFMHALSTEKPCLKCHAAQGYREGDVRGGISVTIPVAELEGMMQSSNTTHLLIVAIVWSLGMAGIWFGIRAIGRGARALSASEERYRLQFQQSGAVMLMLDPVSLRIVDANAAACSYYGYSHADMVTLQITDINTSQPPELLKCIAGVQNGSQRQFMAHHRLSNGTVRDVEVFSNPVVFSDNVLLHSIIIDVSDRLKAEKDLQDKTAFAENLILNSTSPTFVIDAGHKVLIWNRALEELTGVSAAEMVGTCDHWRAFYSAARPCLADIVVDGVQEELPSRYSIYSSSRLIPEGLHAEGDYTFVNRRCRLIFSAAPIRDSAGNLIAAIETLEDITERIALESQLVHAQKMESVGVLAGGIAHDFNNVLTVISGYADLLQLTLHDDDQNMPFAKEISASVVRAAEMTSSLLAFSGKHDILLQYDDLNLILTSIRKSLSRLIREDITLTIQPGEERLAVYVDRVQIEQVLINLVVNACDAIGTGGSITIATMQVECEEARTEGSAVIPPGHYACLTVSDSGTGMDVETLEHIFEPFFTTKEKGKGTGLGLAIVHGILSKHNSHISVISAPERGTEFRIYLPLYAGDKTQSRAEVMLPFNHHGTETVLMVEDDDIIMHMHKEVLGRYGYTSLTASDGVEAMELFTRHRDEIRVAVIDVIMPRMNGREVVERIRQQLPDLPIIMTSGYTDDIVDRATIDDLRVLFLQKPVRPLDLLSAIRNSLERND